MFVSSCRSRISHMLSFFIFIKVVVYKKHCRFNVNCRLILMMSFLSEPPLDRKQKTKSHLSGYLENNLDANMTIIEPYTINNLQMVRKTIKLLTKFVFCFYNVTVKRRLLRPSKFIFIMFLAFPFIFFSFMAFLILPITLITVEYIYNRIKSTILQYFLKQQLELQPT